MFDGFGMSDIKSIIWGLFFVLVMIAWIGHGCKSRMQQFREKREERREERQENWNDWREDHQSIFDRWKERREKRQHDDTGAS